MTRNHAYAPAKSCVVAECDRKVIGLGWCSMHYQRVKKTGSPDGPMPIKPGTIMHLPTRFWAKVMVDLATGCWEWTAFKQATGHAYGYGRFNVDGIPRLAYRLTFEALVGAVPPDLELDHLCRNRGCVNPEHLEPVTHAVNMARSVRAMQTHCKRGHEFTEANTYRAKNGTRSCRRCHADRERARQARKKRTSAA